MEENLQQKQQYILQNQQQLIDVLKQQNDTLNNYYFSLHINMDSQIQNEINQIYCYQLQTAIMDVIYGGVEPDQLMKEYNILNNNPPLAEKRQVERVVEIVKAARHQLKTFYYEQENESKVRSATQIINLFSSIHSESKQTQNYEGALRIFDRRYFANEHFGVEARMQLLRQYEKIRRENIILKEKQYQRIDIGKQEAEVLLQQIKQCMQQISKTAALFDLEVKSQNQQLQSEVDEVNILKQNSVKYDQLCAMMDEMEPQYCDMKEKIEFLLKSNSSLQKQKEYTENQLETYRNFNTEQNSLIERLRSENNLLSQALDEERKQVEFLQSENQKLQINLQQISRSKADILEEVKVVKQQLSNNERKLQNNVLDQVQQQQQFTNQITLLQEYKLECLRLKQLLKEKDKELSEQQKNSVDSVYKIEGLEQSALIKQKQLQYVSAVEKEQTDQINSLAEQLKNKDVEIIKLQQENSALQCNLNIYSELLKQEKGK